MPPMWTVPLRVMAGFAFAAGGDGPAPVRRSAPGGRVARGFAAGGDGVGVVARSGRPGHLAGVLGLLRGDAPGQALVGALGVAGCGRSGRPVSRGLGDSVGQGLPARVAERGLAEALVVARGWWACRGSAGGGFDARGAHVPRPGGPVTGRRLGPGAAPLSAARAPGARPGRPRPCRRRRWPPGRPSPGATSQATARRQWSSWSRPGHRPCARRPGRTRWRRAAGGRWGRGGSNRRHAALGLLDGSAPPRPLPTGRSWPATPARAPRGPWRPSLPARADRTVAPVPSAPGAARTSRARARTRSGRRLGPASRTARPGLARRRGPLPPARAGARRRSVLRQMPCSAPNVVTAPRGASSGHRAIARRTRGPALRFLSGLTPQSQTTSVTTRTRRTVTDVLIQNCHPCPET